MKTQIKVKDTRMHKLANHYVFTKILGESHDLTKDKEVPVAEGKHVLVPIMERNLIGLLPNGFQYFHGKDYVDTWPQPCKWFKPIIISETETIEVGDWVYGGNKPKLFQVKDEEHLDYLNKASKKFPQHKFNKVLALPEHFSPKHLQAIVEGKLKDGDKVLVECKKYVTWPNAKYHWDRGEHYRINLNSSGHITLHKLEERIYTEEEVKKTIYHFCEWRSNNYPSLAHPPYLSDRIKAYFEQNVK